MELPQLTFLLFRRPPPRVWPEGLAGIGSIGSGPLVLTDDRVECPLHHRLHGPSQQEEFLEASAEDVDAVLEVGLEPGLCWVAGPLAGAVGGATERVVRVDHDVRPIGEEPVHRYQDELSEDLLFDAAFCLGVEVLDLDDLLARLVELLHAPSGVVDVHKLP